MNDNTSKEKFDVTVVGLGYVGLTLATALADVGLKVLGIEKRASLVEKTNAGVPHFAEKGLDKILKKVVSSGHLKASTNLDRDVLSNTFIITVGTPLDENGSPRTDMIANASHEVARVLKPGNLVVLRSTVMVGTTRKVVADILEATKVPFMLAMCPERTLEGKAMEELHYLPQIIGSPSLNSRRAAANLFHKLTSSVIEVDDYETAELIKLVDNTYRDVTFAFANEVARICDGIGINAVDVINYGKMGYERTNVPLPGPVGGPCLEKDPHILTQSAKNFGVDLKITPAARSTNERQPIETVDFIKREAKKRFGDNRKIKIVLAGLAFKGRPETDDLRGSMALHILEELRANIANASIHIYDPVIEKEYLKEYFPDTMVSDCLHDSFTDADIFIIANNHPIFSDLDFGFIQERMACSGFIFDYWNHFSGHSRVKQSEAYFGLGNTRKN